MVLGVFTGAIGVLCSSPNAIHSTDVLASRATDFIWNGTAGTTELWSSTSNWTPAGIPVFTDTAVFDSSGRTHQRAVLSECIGLQERIAR